MFFKKRLTVFYRTVLQEKGENVKFLAQDMESYISRKQAEVSDYRDYLNRSYNQLVQEKIEKYEDAKELYDELCRILLGYSQCYFEIRLLGKQKQDVFMGQKLCGSRQGIISEYQKNYYAAIGECKELIQILERATDDTMYNYLILYHNQELLGVVPDKIEEYAEKVKYAELQQKLHENCEDNSAKNAWFYAKTVEEALSIYRKEAEQLKTIRRQIYGKIEDCKAAREQLRRAGNVLKGKMEELKARQQSLQNRQQQQFDEARKTWEDYVARSSVCKEYDYQIFLNQQKMDMLQKEIEGKKDKITDKRSRLETIKNAQNDVKNKRNSLIEENKFDAMMLRGYGEDIRKIIERKNTYLGIAARARERRSSLCWDHKCLSQTVREIKNSHTNDPGFSDKISKLNSLSYYIDKATAENDTYMENVDSCNREIEEKKKHAAYHKANLDRRDLDIDRYKSELDSLSEDYTAVQGDINLLKAEIDIIYNKKKPYRDNINSLKRQKKAYIDSQFDEFKELTRMCRKLLEG